MSWIEENAECMYPDSDITYGVGAVREAYAYGANEALKRLTQPLVTSLEELDSLPHETVIRDSQDFVFERIVHYSEDPEWWGTTDFLNETKVTLPVRVLYLPEVKP